METRCCHKTLNFKDTRRPISVPLAMSASLYRKNPNLKKKKTGQKLGQDRPEKHSAKCLIQSGEVPSPRQTSIHKSNDRVMKSERGALVRSSDPHSGHSSVYPTVGDMWRAPARRLKKKWPLACRKQTTKKLVPLGWQNIDHFSGLGDEHRTPRATSRPLDHGST